MEGVRGGEGERAASSSAPSRSGGGDGIVRTASSTIEASRASCRGETTPSAAGSSTASPDAGAASSASASAAAPSASSSFSSGPPCHPNPGRAAGRRSGFGVGGGPSAGSGDPGPPVVSAAARRRPPSSSAIATSAPRPCVVVVVVFFFFRCSADIASDRGVRGVFFFFRGGSGWGGGWLAVSLPPVRCVRVPVSFRLSAPIG
uniref:Uncharacterized protein n=1 Tax=Human herpesvirus 2 TaxID=10310 RepID=A0A481TZ43_HHV2|nr:hypothetical protein [Human alphaherpesvirus 2]